MLFVCWFDGVLGFCLFLLFLFFGVFFSPTDKNECEEGTDDCHTHALCYNTDGSFYCQCESGFEGDGHDSCSGKIILHFCRPK